MARDDSSGERPHPPLERLVPNPKLKFMEQCREVMRFHRLAARTEETYLQWIKRYILFHDKRHPKELGEPEVNKGVSPADSNIFTTS